MTSAALPGPRRGRARRSTATARFGSSVRESHDASAFYERFVAPELSGDATVVSPKAVDVVFEADARDMQEVASSSVALVVTSPPYFAGKEYELTLGRDGVPGSYLEYLGLLRDVFQECKRVLEPGGRIAVNVANLGRRPYRSLAGDVTGIFEDLGLLLRGEVIWWKGRAAGGSCAWGTFQRPGNPVLRDVTERVVIASKGRFDRAMKPEQRHRLDRPSTATISRDEVLEATTDLWEIPTESATRVGHPAPFPVALPARLIELYTYEGDLVLDPFLGSGTTAVAAVQSGRRYVGFETDRSYVERSRARIAEELDRQSERTAPSTAPWRVELPAVPRIDDTVPALEAAVRDGRRAREVATVLLATCGFDSIRTDVKVAGLGIEVDLLATGPDGGTWAFEVCGTLTTNRTGLRRADVLWKAIGKAAVLHGGRPDLPLVLIATDVPPGGSPGGAALDAVRGPSRPVLDVIRLLDADDHRRLRAHAEAGPPAR